MSGSEASAAGPPEAIPEANQQPRAKCGCPAAACGFDAIGGAIRQICPTCDEVKERAERLRDSIRAQPLVAVAVALGLGVFIGRVTGARHRSAGVR